MLVKRVPIPLLLPALIAAVMPARAAAADATITEVEQTFLTYPYGDPSPLAQFGRIYPYTRFDGGSAQGTMRAWKLVRLENDWLVVWVAPGIGGKIWGAMDKVSGRDFIYRNPVVKFRDVGLRGPWTSGGIEFNFGTIGHAPSCAAPVDYALARDADGGVRCTVGALDLPSSTRWRVEIRLPRDQAAITTTASWENPTPYHQSCYQWMTAAAEAADDLTMLHPGEHYLEHGGIAHPWPVDAAGRDLSAYRANTFGPDKSYHVLGAATEWFGGYWSGRAGGYAHWSLLGDKPGQKLWLWSQARDGALWRDLLTDAPAPQYIEIQSGLMPSQADENSSATPFKHAALAPGQTLRWSEQWFPLSGIGGLVDASPWGALNIVQVGGHLEIRCCPLRALDAELRVAADGSVFHRQRLKGQPLTVLSADVDLAGHVGTLSVEVGDHLLSWRSDDGERLRLHRPLAADGAADPASAEGLFTAGEEHLRQRDYAPAMESFTSCLAVEPHHLRALARVAELQNRRGEHDQAAATAARALAIDAGDAEANLCWAVANAALGHSADAKDGFGWAERSGDLRAAALAGLAGACIRERELWRAAEYARRGAEDGSDECRFLQAVVARLDHHPDVAAGLVADLLARDPLHAGARSERCLLAGDAQARAAFAAGLRGEDPTQDYLELAARYTSLGCDADAVTLLALAPPGTLTDLWLAWLQRASDPAASDRALDRALAAPVRGVFPAQAVTIAVLRWAQQRRPHWKTGHLLGLLLVSLGRVDEAAALLAAAGDAPDEAAFYLNRAQVRHADGERPALLADLRRALQLAPQDWRAPHALIRALLDGGGDDLAAARATAVDAAQHFPGNQALTLDLALVHLWDDRPREALAALAGLTVLPNEGAYEGRALFRRANLLAAVAALEGGAVAGAEAFIAAARTWPERLGSGRPYDTDERLEDLLAARCRQALGDDAGVRLAYTRIAATTAARHTRSGAALLVSALALRGLDRKEEGAALLRDWPAATPVEEALRAWARARFANDLAAATQALRDPATGQPFPLWRLARSQPDFPLIVAMFRIPAP